ncbi:hypothetical protein BV20DRAFT_420526 [Pilatotrama ljubarskyi]|nr:hypothetical protein BV20DRAFT_420526 [Pilatotrama ljubarskyi]
MRGWRASTTAPGTVAAGGGDPLSVEVSRGAAHDFTSWLLSATTVLLGLVAHHELASRRHGIILTSGRKDGHMRALTYWGAELLPNCKRTATDGDLPNFVDNS